MAFYPAQVSFAGGELAPSLWGREDLAKYAVGVRELTNFTVHPHGGVSNRAGMRFIAETRNSGSKARLVPFESNSSGVYVLEFGDHYIRFFKDDAQLMSGGSPYEIVSPYAADDLKLLSFAQSADVLFIAHPDYCPYELSRYGDLAWTMTKFAFKNGPFRNINSGDTTLAVSGTSGTVTVTASAALFNTKHVGALFSIYNHVDSVSQKAGGDVSGAWLASSINGGTEEVSSGDKTTTKYYFYCSTDTQRAQFTTGRKCRFSGTECTVASVAGDRVTFSPSPGWSEGVISCDVFMTSASSAWGVSVSVYKAWKVVSNGFWSGTVKLWRYNSDEVRWVLVQSYTSGSTSTSAKNYEESGTVDDPCKFKLTSDDFASFVPEGNTDADRGYFILTADEADYECYLRVNSVSSATSAVCTFEKDAAQTDATRNWAEGAWSDYRGWPTAVGFYQDRLCFGGNASDPQSVWMSVTGDYNNFERHLILQDDDAVTAALVSRRVSPVRAFVPLSSLVVLTEGSEWTVGAGNAKTAVTPSAMEAQTQGYRGAAAVPPVVIGDMVLFVQKQGKIIRDLGYVFESDSYSGNDLTVLASHMFQGKSIVSMDYQQDPDSIVWAALDDGTLLALCYLREHDVIAWAKMKTEGEVESVACVSTSERDETWLVVRRKINGSYKRFVELLADRYVVAPEAGFFVDCGKSFNFTYPSDALTGLEHLEGCSVACLADGNVVSGLTVKDGAVALPYKASVVHLGLPYTSALETLDLTLSRRDGTQQGRGARLVSVKVRVENTRGLCVMGVEADDSVDSPAEFKERRLENYGAPTKLQTGIMSVGLSSGYSSGRVRIEQRNPLPCTVLSLLPKVALGEG